MPSLVIVANRLPVQAPARGRGPWTRSPGGLADALHSTLVDRGGTWIGWPGGRQHRPASRRTSGTTCSRSASTPADLRGYYDGFSNATLWPLYHDVIRQPVYHRAWWHDYAARERALRRRGRRHRGPGRTRCGSTTTTCSSSLRWCASAGPTCASGSSSTSRSRPPTCSRGFRGGSELLDGVAGADLVGFQTPRDAEQLLRGGGALRRPRPRRATCGSLRRTTSASPSIPVSIDYEHWNEIAHLPEVEKRVVELREQLGNPRAVLLGVDRLDYTKGIEQRLHAFRELLTEGRLTVPDVGARPGREPEPRPGQRRTATSGAASSSSSARSTATSLGSGAPAVHYIHQPLEPVEVAPLYRAADVMLVTPLRDGMNLVAKEFVASRYADHGVLVLSEFAGAAHELTDALLVNPHDIEGIKRAILTALSMPEEEVIRRMRALRIDGQEPHRLRLGQALPGRPRPWQAEHADRSRRTPKQRGVHRRRPVTRRRRLGADPARRVRLRRHDRAPRRRPRPGAARTGVDRRAALARIAPRHPRRGDLGPVVARPRRAEPPAPRGAPRRLPRLASSSPGSRRTCPTRSARAATQRDPSSSTRSRAGLPGAIVERKPASVAFHYRLVEPGAGRRRS